MVFSFLSVGFVIELYILGLSSSNLSNEGILLAKRVFKIPFPFSSFENRGFISEAL